MDGRDEVMCPFFWKRLERGRIDKRAQRTNNLSFLYTLLMGRGGRRGSSATYIHINRIQPFASHNRTTYLYRNTMRRRMLWNNIQSK